MAKELNDIERLISNCALGNGRDAFERKDKNIVYCPYSTPNNQYICYRTGKQKVVDMGTRLQERLQEVYICNWK